MIHILIYDLYPNLWMISIFMIRIQILWFLFKSTAKFLAGLGLEPVRNYSRHLGWGFEVFLEKLGNCRGFRWGRNCISFSRQGRYWWLICWQRRTRRYNQHLTLEEVLQLRCRAADLLSNPEFSLVTLFLCSAQTQSHIL